MGLAFLLDHLPWTVPYTGYVMTPSPDARQALALMASGCAGSLLTRAALWIGARPRRARFGFTRPTSPPRASTRWPVLGILAALLVVNWLYTLVNVANPTFAAIVLFSGVLVCIVLLGPATASLLAGVASGVVACARRFSWPTACLVGRELVAMARPAVRATVFMGVVALTGTFATVIATLPHEVLRTALGASTLNADRSVSIRTGDSARWVPELAASLPDNEHLVQLVQGLGARDGRLTAPCRTQEALLGTCAGPAPSSLDSLVETVPDPLRAWGVSSRTVVVTGEVMAGQILVLTDDGARVDAAGLGGTLRGLVSPTPRITEPGSEWIVGAGLGGTTGVLATYSAVRVGDASAASAGATSVALIVVATVTAGVASVATAVSTSSAARGGRPG